jgi:CheY-like chemotaxis protein
MTEALAAATQHELDIVLSDIGLPDGDGFELMNHLRTLRPGILGIAVSGYGTEADIAKSHAAGFSEHLTKPIHMNSLEQALNRLLGQAH